MKLSLPQNQLHDRMKERERRYPIYVAIDLTIYWLLYAALFLVAVGLCGLILYNTSPGFAAWISPWLRSIRG